MTFFIRIISVISIFFSAEVFSFTSYGYELNALEKVMTAPRKNKTILTVFSKTYPNGRQFTISELEGLGLQELEIELAWEGETGLYQGIYLKDLLAEVGLETTPVIEVIALDNYSLKIPRKIWQNGKVILVTRQDGNIISIRKKGPTRLMFPTQEAGILKGTQGADYWIWSLKTIQGE